MAKIISYQFQPNEGSVLYNAEIVCRTKEDFDANYPIAESEAVGEITVVGEFDPEPEPEPETEASVWDELDAAYQEGVNSV